MTKWVDCLKEYNRNKRVWCVARKGTRDYKKIMNCVKGDKNAFVEAKKKKKLKIVEKFEDEKPRNIQENPDLVVDMKRLTINDVPTDVMNYMGQFLNTKDKAKLNQASKNIKVKYSKDDYIEYFKTAVDKWLENDIGQYINTLEMINATSIQSEVVENKINAYYKKYFKEVDKYNKRIINYIKSKKFSAEVEKNLIDYFIEKYEDDRFETYLTTIRNSDEYTDYYQEYWSIGETTNIFRSALQPIRSAMKELPTDIKKRYELIIDLINKYIELVGKNTIIKLPTEY